MKWTNLSQYLKLGDRRPENCWPGCKCEVSVGPVNDSIDGCLDPISCNSNTCIYVRSEFYDGKICIIFGISKHKNIQRQKYIKRNGMNLNIQVWEYQYTGYYAIGYKLFELLIKFAILVFILWFSSWFFSLKILFTKLVLYFKFFYWFVSFNLFCQFYKHCV